LSSPPASQKGQGRFDRAFQVNERSIWFLLLYRWRPAGRPRMSCRCAKVNWQRPAGETPAVRQKQPFRRKLLHTQEVVTNKVAAAAARRGWFRVRLTGTGFIQVSLNRS